MKSSKYNQYGSGPKQLHNSTNFSEVDPSWMKSPAWKYFLRNKKDGLAKCKNCLLILKMGQSTSPLIKHLKFHNIDLKVPKYLDLLFKAVKTVKPTSVEAERAFSAMGFLLKLETEWVIKPLMHWFQWGNIISWSQKRLSKWWLKRVLNLAWSTFFTTQQGFGLYA